MSANERLIAASPDQVWAVLADGWLYPSWVVGATRMRHVEEHWPAPGAQLHHSVGVWPLVLDDTTEVDVSEPGKVLAVRARAWPSGEAAVTIRLTADEGGTRVQIEEDAARGPGRLVPAAVRGPLLRWRNTETLSRLAFIVEGRESTPG